MSNSSRTKKTERFNDRGDESEPIGLSDSVLPSAEDKFGPITGRYMELAMFLRSIVGSNASVRGIARKTGVNFSTCSTMLKGERSSPESAIKFGRAYKINPNTILRLSNLEEIPELDFIDWSTSTPTQPIRQVRQQPVSVASSSELEDVRIRVITEFELVTEDGESRPLTEKDLTPHVRRQLEAILLSGALDESSTTE